MTTLHKLVEGGKYSKLDKFIDKILSRRIVMFICKCGSKYALWLYTKDEKYIVCPYCGESLSETRAAGRVILG